MKITRLFVFFFFFILSETKAQSTDSANVEENKTQFKIGINYNSNLNYYGRTDSLRSSGFFPLAELWFTPQFYINAAPIFVNNKIQRFEYAGTVATVGYQFNANNKWFGNLYALKPFYKSNSTLVQSALKAQGGASITWLNSVLNLTVGGDIKFSDKTDYGASAGLDHIVRLPFEDESVFVIDPSAYIYAGTQQFSETYYKKSKFLFFPGSQQQVSETSARFNILAYEFSVPLIYAKNRFQLSATPSYIIPQNLISVPGRPDLSERGKETFYLALGAKLTL
ncbi:MAG TPA: hypothetical protein VIQ00_00190 [Chitinophagaceae bacterium]